ncbi:MAG: hypothetical protein LUG13_08335 [Oscillospiraceae bacterium]|nr:hypothetical protein [Oscillospiraceae bacterium]
MFYDNLKQICAEQGLKVTPIVNECGATGSIAGWKNGRSPSSDVVIKLAMRLNVSTDRLLFGAERYNLSPEQQEFIKIYDSLDEEGRTIVRAALYYARDRTGSTAPEVLPPVLIGNNPLEYGMDVPVFRSTPVYDLPASAGTGLFLDSDTYTLMDFLVEVVPIETSFGVRIRGDSMSPQYADGDIVFVKQQRTLDHNEVGVFVLNGSAYCKRLIEKGGKAFLASSNQEYPPLPICEYDEVRVVGKVVGSITP